nr:methionyl aminopeptidase [Clostridioides sp.]
MKIGRNDKCWCGSGKKYKTCHEAFDQKIEQYRSKGHIVPSHDLLKLPEDIEGLKSSAKINISVLDYIGEHIKEGITTQQIDDWVNEVTTKQGGIPATLGYEGYPKSCCTSINNQVCHGIPSEDIMLKDGDIINVDVSTIYKGYFSDSSRMYCIGNVKKEYKDLVQVCQECVQKGLEQVKPWGFFGDMGEAVYNHAIKHRYTVVEEVGGHGIGKEFHEDPFVSYVTKKGTEMLLVPGMVFTIEPMINMGSEEVYLDEENGWTIYTSDEKPSAQWEIMVLVTETGYDVLSY